MIRRVWESIVGEVGFDGGMWENLVGVRADVTA